MSIFANPYAHTPAGALREFNKKWRKNPLDPTFGKEDIGATCNGTSTIYACKYQMGSKNGSLTHITIYNKFGESTFRFYVGIYTDDNGYPDSLLATSSEQTPATGSAWNEAAVTCNLTASTYYWLAMHANTSDLQRCYDAGLTNQFYYATRTYQALPSTFPAGATGRDRELSIFGTYTETIVGGLNLSQIMPIILGAE